MFFDEFPDTKLTQKNLKEKYLNEIKPNIILEKLTLNEKNLIMENYQKNKSRWSLHNKSLLLPGRCSNQIKNFYYSNYKKLIRKITKEIIKKDNYNISKKQLRYNSKITCDKIYNKIFKRKINYFQLNEKLIKDIIHEDKENKNSEENCSWSNHQNSEFTKSYADNEAESSSSNKNFFSILNMEYEKSIFKEENTFENFLFQEKQNNLLNKNNNFSLYDDYINFDLEKETATSEKLRVNENLISEDGTLKSNYFVGYLPRTIHFADCLLIIK